MISHFSEIPVHWEDGQLFVGGTAAKTLVAKAIARGWLWLKSPEELRAAAKAADEAEAKAEATKNNTPATNP